MCATRLLGLNVEDELQAEGRVAAAKDPTTASQPCSEIIAAMTPSMVRKAAPRRRIPTSEGVGPFVVGTSLRDAGTYADALARVAVRTRTRLHAVRATSSATVHDGLAHVARLGGRTSWALGPTTTR